MDTWILVADELHAALLVQSTVGSLHEIESWDCHCDAEQQSFVCEIARRIESLQTDFDSLVVAAPPSLLENLSLAFGDSLNGRVAAELAKDLSQLSSRELRSQLQELIPA
jgi:protein required for attachment to host cells